VAETVAAKKAILDALGLDKEAPALWAEIQVRLVTASRVYVKLAKSVQERAWQLRALDYKIAFNHSTTQVMCTATATADMRDVLA
jgi:phosphopantetheinyl transferase (holo-ACP synthase)